MEVNKKWPKCKPASPAENTGRRKAEQKEGPVLERTRFCGIPSLSVPFRNDFLSCFIFQISSSIKLPSTPCRVVEHRTSQSDRTLLLEYQSLSDPHSKPYLNSLGSTGSSKAQVA